MVAWFDGCVPPMAFSDRFGRCLLGAYRLVAIVRRRTGGLYEGSLVEDGSSLESLYLIMHSPMGPD